MLIVWDEPKRLANVANHEMDFADLDEAFFETAVIVPVKFDRLAAVGRQGELVEGAAVEMAAAKALEHYWVPSVDTFKTGSDIGTSIQVRTRSRHSYDLIVRPDDRDEDHLVLVTGIAPRFHVRATILGARCQASRILGRDEAPGLCRHRC